MTRPVARWATAVLHRLGLTVDDLFGFRFAVNVALGTTIVWHSLQAFGERNPIWAIASMIAASEPQPGESWRMFRCRVVNGVIGGAIGLVFLLMNGPAVWVLPIALATTVLLSAYLVRVKTMWRQAPITAAVILAAGITAGSTSAGIERGLLRVAQVIFGCLVGLVVSLVMSKLWLIQEPYETHPDVKSAREPRP